MKLDKRHKWAESEDGELVFYQCIVCGEERTETILARDLRLSIEREKAKKDWARERWLDKEIWRTLHTPVFAVPKLPDHPGETVTFKRYPRLELPK
jgi:hypothetical protein